MPTKKSRSWWAKERRRFVLNETKILEDEILRYQGYVWRSVREDVLEKLEYHASGRLKRTKKNFSVLGVFKRLDRRLKQGRKRRLMERVAKNLIKQSSLAESYFSSMMNYRDTVNNTVKEILFQRIGYDPSKGFLSSGSVFDTWQDSSDLRAIQKQLAQAISSGQQKEVFLNSIQNFVVGDKNNGIVERHLKTEIRDIYAANDNLLSKAYADALKLTLYHYEGTLIERSRPFCIERVNKIFTEEEIEKWYDIDFKGKNDPYNPYALPGGYQCRHTLMPITEKAAERMGYKITG